MLLFRHCDLLLQAWGGKLLLSSHGSAEDLQLRVAYQIHDLAASRWRRPADPGGKPARGAPSPGRLLATRRGLCSSWRCVSPAESPAQSPTYSQNIYKSSNVIALHVFQLKPAELRVI